MNRNMEWTRVVSSAILLLFLLEGCLCIPVEEKLGSDKAITEGRDHKGSNHEGISSFLGVRNRARVTLSKTPKKVPEIRQLLSRQVWKR